MIGRPSRLAKAALPVWAQAALPLLLPAMAHAAELGGGQIAIEIQLANEDGDFVAPTEEERRKFFNLAHCQCNSEFAAELDLVDAPATVPKEPVEIWVGANCDDFLDPNRFQKCQELSGFREIEDLRSPQEKVISARALMYPNQATCGADEDTRWVYAIIDDDQGNNEPENVFQAEVFFDTLGPPPPEDAQANPGEGAITVTWELSDSGQSDITWFQALCWREDGQDTGIDHDEPEFQTAASLCGAPTAVPIVSSRSASAADGGIFDAMPAPDAGAFDAMPGPDAGFPGDDIALDPSLVCGTASSTETELRIEGLEEGVAYRVVLVAIDTAGNPSAVDLGTVEPRDVIDFWEDYKDRGGQAQSGFCATTLGASSPGGLGILLLVLVAAAWGAGRRLRRSRR